MFARFRRARADLVIMNQLFPAAEQLARAEGIDHPAAEHLVLAALDLDDHIARDALADVNVDRSALQAAIVDQHDVALRSVGIAADDHAIDASLPEPAPATGPFRSQGSLQQLFQQAVEVAKTDRTSLNSGHVLLAATDSDHGSIARALELLAVDRHHLHARIRRRLDATT